VRRLALGSWLLLVGVIAAAAESDLTARLEAVRPKLDSPKKELRQQAYAAYLAEGEPGRQALRNALTALHKAKLERCHSLSLADATQKRLLTVHKKMEEARKEALRVIFDPKIYPDADHGRVGQPIVDEKVKIVKAGCPIHQAAFGWAMHRVPHGEAAPRGGKAEALMIFFSYGSPIKTYQGALAAYGRLLEIDDQLAKLGGGGEGVELKPTLAKAVGSAIDPELLDALGKTNELLDYSVRCLRYNALVATSTTDGERTVLDLTNEYRIQLGIKPMAINEPLVQAARKHSREMVELKYFGHESPKPENRTVGQRCANEGYKGGGAENCASGAGPAGAFDMWYHSSGHHRNMIGPGHNEIGIGGAGPWTEDFGSRKGLDLNNPPHSWKHEEPKAKK